MGTQLDYTLEIIDAAMEGDIDFEKEFNLRGYIYTIKKSRELENYRRKKKVLRINDTVDEVTDYGDGVPVDALSGFVDKVDDFEKFESDDEVLYAVEEINKISNDILVCYHLDIKRCIKQALRGTPESLNLLKGLVEENKYIGELVKILLASGYSLEALL